jgi:flavin reductase (DIM6/NTAB) family NADH-FMN oxidoreductase RutF
MSAPGTSTYAPTDERSLGFRRALRHFPTGVSVVTVGAPGDVHGMTASSFCPISLEPRLCSVSVNKPGRMHQLLAETDGLYGLSILNREQGAIADCYARQPWAANLDIDFEERHGCSFVPNALAWFVCRKWASYDGGDHTIFVGEVLELGSTAAEGVEPLIFHHSEYFQRGPQLDRGRDAV